MDEDLSQISCISAPWLANQGRLDAVSSAASVAGCNCVNVLTGGHLSYPHNNFPLAVDTVGNDALLLHNRWSDGNAVRDEKDVKDACTYIAKYAAKPLVKKKRERPVCDTYNFSPPSTPRGNHTITIDADTVSTRCSMKRLIQQEDRPICIVCGALMQSMAGNRLCFKCNTVFID